MNNKLLLHILTILLGILSLTACNRADEWEATGGDTGLLVTLTDATTGGETRAIPQELREQLGEEFLQQFRLTITHLAGKHEVYDSIPYDGELIRLPAGFYDVEAKFGDNPTLALDAPYYTGRTEDVEVKGHQQKSVSIACSVANALLSVKYENVDKLDEKFTDYYVSVHVGEESVDIKDTKQSAYFRAGSSPRLYFCCDGREPLPLTGDAIPETFQARDHLILTLRMSPTLTMEIAKVEMKQVTVEEIVPENWLPKPKIEAVGFGEDNTLTFAETEKKEARLNLNTQLGLQDLKLTFQFEDEQFASLNGKEYQLSNPADKAAVEQALDITLPDIGDTGASVDLSPLIARMQTKAGETVTNRLTIDVRANDRWSSEDAEANRTYTMVCNKPEFSIAVQPGNVWTKQFTIDEVTVTAGDAETIKGQLQYQYKAEGSEEWVNSDQLLVSWSEAPATKKYQVRAVYRGEISTEEIDVELETPIQLPNGNMEDWSIESKTKSGTWPFKDKIYYTFHPYAQEGQSSSWWDTNNDKAQGGIYALGIWYEGCFASCVSYTEDAHGGTKAALMYVSGCGDSYANTSDTYVGGAMVGSLYIGQYNSGIVQGHDFGSRPTSLSFWYKYKPYNSDAFKVVVSLKNGDNEIATGTYEPTAYSAEDNAYTQASINLVYTNTQDKATTICVQFLASNKSELSGSDFAWGTTINYPVIGNWTVHMGSILKIDDISLIYDK